MYTFKGQTVAVVGGSSGIGAAVAKAFAALGASVAIASRNGGKLKSAADEIGAGVRASQLDTTDAAAVARFFRSTGQLDHVVVSAAETAVGSVKKLPLSDARAAMESKFWGAYHIACAVDIAPGGSLTFVSGFLAVRPNPSAVLQGAINAALESLSRGLALELSPVRVNTVSPGIVDTPLWAKMDESARNAMYAETAAALPAKRIGRPEDIANAVIYLAGTPFTTGSTVLVDGGGAIG